MKYQVIVADPPWRVKAGPRSLHNKGQVSRQLTYPTMSLEQICELPVWKLAEDNSVLFLWTINKYIEQSYSVARAWGFKPSTMLVWAKKPKGRGLGGTFGISTEFILFATRGKQPTKDRYESTWFSAPRKAHSEKPDEFYKIVENCFEGNKIDVFGRKKREGWHVWGNEVESDIDLSLKEDNE